MSTAKPQPNAPGSTVAPGKEATPTQRPSQRHAMLLLLVLALCIACWLPLRGMQKLAPRQAQVQQQWQQVQQLGAQAQALRQQAQQLPSSSAPNNPVQQQAAIEQLLPSGASLQLNGQQYRVQLAQVPAPALAQALEQLQQQLPLRTQSAQWQLSNGLVSGSLVLEATP